MSHTTFSQFVFFLQALEEGNSKLSYFFPKIVFVVSLCSLYFFILYNIFWGKRARTLNLNYILSLLYPVYLAYVLRRTER